MRHSIDTYIQGIINDNKSYILDGGYTSVADYLISEAENGLGWIEFFDDEELDGGEPSEEQIDNLRGFLSRNYDYLPIDDDDDLMTALEAIDKDASVPDAIDRAAEQLGWEICMSGFFYQEDYFYKKGVGIIAREDGFYTKSMKHVFEYYTFDDSEEALEFCDLDHLAGDVYKTTCEGHDILAFGDSFYADYEGISYDKLVEAIVGADDVCECEEDFRILADICHSAHLRYPEEVGYFYPNNKITLRTDYGPIEVYTDDLYEIKANGHTLLIDVCNDIAEIRDENRAYVDIYNEDEPESNVNRVIEDALISCAEELCSKEVWWEVRDIYDAARYLSAHKSELVFYEEITAAIAKFDFLTRVNQRSIFPDDVWAYDDEHNILVFPDAREFIVADARYFLDPENIAANLDGRHRKVVEGSLDLLDEVAESYVPSSRDDLYVAAYNGSYIICEIDADDICHATALNEDYVEQYKDCVYAYNADADTAEEPTEFVPVAVSAHKAPAPHVLTHDDCDFDDACSTLELEPHKVAKILRWYPSEVEGGLTVALREDISE